MSSWYEEWFNQDYLQLYAHRDQQEAAEQVSLLIQALELQGGERILDMGCGSGRHALEFALRGWNVTGIDLSSVLIAEAIQKQKQHPGLKLEFHQGDMRHLPDLGKFDLVLNLFTSFGYFDSDAENQRIFFSARNSLNADGQFFLDYLHPSSVRRSLVPEEEKLVGHEVVHIHKEIKGHTIIKTIRFPNRTYTERVKLYSRAEIEQMLKAERLQPIEVWNDYKGNPWKEEGDRQLFRCRIWNGY